MLQVGVVPLGLLAGFLPPLLLPEGERGKEREKEKERGLHPLPHSNSASSLVGGGVPAACGLVSPPPMAHMAHIFPRGVPVTPLVLRYVSDTLWNPSGVRILPSNISIFTSQPFRDSSSCP